MPSHLSRTSDITIPWLCTCCYPSYFGEKPPADYSRFSWLALRLPSDMKMHHIECPHCHRRFYGRIFASTPRGYRYWVKAETEEAWRRRTEPRIVTSQAGTAGTVELDGSTCLGISWWRYHGRTS